LNVYQLKNNSDYFDFKHKDQPKGADLNQFMRFKGNLARNIVFKKNGRI
jgi:hypothetical protein